MTKNPKLPKSSHALTATPDGETLLETYGAMLGDDMPGSEIDEEQAKAFLLALWQIMQAFVDLGFDMKPGEKFHENSELGFDDVLRYLHPEETAHETVAPRNSNPGEEQP